jgi:hypothetical protein
VRTAPDTTENGQTVRTTTVRTVLPADPLTIERKTPDFWDYLEALPKDWDRHLLYVYRRHSDSGPLIPLEKCSGYLTMPGGAQVALNNREEVEFALAGKYGGGTYRLILKKGSERVTEGRVTVDGPPKNTAPGIFDSTPTVSPSTADTSTTDVAKTAMNIVSTHESEAINTGLSMMRNAADVMQRLAGAPATSATDDVMKQAMLVMLQKALNPPDPVDALTKLLTLMQAMNGGNSANGESPLVTRILETGLERVLNPPAASGPVSSTGAELVRALPQVIGVAAEAAKEWRLGSEAQLQTAQIMANSNRAALPPGQVQPPAAPPGRPITQATQITPEAQAMPAGAPSLEFVESKIVEILRKPISADECADEVLSFLDVIDPTLVDRLAAVGEAQLIQIFQTRPVLRQYHDLARLQEFIKAFLKYSKENEEPTAPSVPVKPN